MVIVTRVEWGSRPTSPPRDLDGTPEPYVFVHHMASRWPTSPDDERALMRETQRYAIEAKGYSDMDYTAAVGPSGIIYEGRGWDRIPGATKDMNAVSRAVVAMGNLDVQPPTSQQVCGIADAIRHMIDLGELAPDVTILGHRDSPAHPGATACPGRYLYAELDTIRALVFPPIPPTPPLEDPVSARLVYPPGGGIAVVDHATRRYLANEAEAGQLRYLGVVHNLDPVAISPDLWAQLRPLDP